MERFEFDQREAVGFPNSNRKNGVTVRGNLELYDNFPRPGLLSLDIRGPEGAYRGSAIFDKATAGKLGAALLKWAMPNGDPEGCCYWPCELLGDALAALEKAVTFIRPDWALHQEILVLIDKAKQ